MYSISRFLLGIALGRTALLGVSFAFEQDAICLDMQERRDLPGLENLQEGGKLSFDPFQGNLIVFQDMEKENHSIDQLYCAETVYMYILRGDKPAVNVWARNTRGYTSQDMEDAPDVVDAKVKNQMLVEHANCGYIHVMPTISLAQAQFEYMGFLLRHTRVLSDISFEDLRTTYSLSGSGEVDPEWRYMVVDRNGDVVKVGTGDASLESLGSDMQARCEEYQCNGASVLGLDELNVDGDERPNIATGEVDIDADSLLDIDHDAETDTDGDGVINKFDLDIDCDGLRNGGPEEDDIDGDGQDDSEDDDADGDGEENDEDRDGDCDGCDGGDKGGDDNDDNGDNVVDPPEDIDPGEGEDGEDGEDGEGGEDSDGDGVPDDQEREDGTDPNDPDDFKDSDGDGIPDHLDDDDDNDGVPDDEDEDPTNPGGGRQGGDRPGPGGGPGCGGGGSGDPFLTCTAQLQHCRDRCGAGDDTCTSLCNSKNFECQWCVTQAQGEEEACACKYFDHIYLNTDIPFIGQCILKTTNRSGGGADNTPSETSTANLDSAFPRLMSGLARLLQALIIVAGLCAVIIGGFLVTMGGLSSGAKEQGVKLLKIVVVAFVLLGASGLILNLINPNFFG